MLNEFLSKQLRQNRVVELWQITANNPNVSVKELESRISELRYPLKKLDVIFVCHLDVGN